MNLLEHQVGEFPVRAGRICRVSFRVFRGRQRLDVRIYYKDVDGDYKPTPKGVNFSVDDLPELRRLIIDAERLAVEAGQIDPDDQDET